MAGNHVVDSHRFTDLKGFEDFFFSCLTAGRGVADEVEEEEAFFPAQREHTCADENRWCR